MYSTSISIPYLSEKGTAAYDWSTHITQMMLQHNNVATLLAYILLLPQGKLDWWHLGLAPFM